MLVLGVDPGLVRTGYGLLEAKGNHYCVVEAGVLKPPRKAPLPLRLEHLHKGLFEILSEHSPDLMVLEALYSNYRLPKTAILMGHARGVLCLAAAEAGVPVESCSATFVKRAVTGAGHASKEQMQRTLAQRLRLAEIPSPPDVADALGLALAYLEKLTNPLFQASRANQALPRPLK